MKTLEELKAEIAELNKQIEDQLAASIYLITQSSEVLFLNYMPEWVKDETLIFQSEEWSREEVERIALACKQLRKSLIRSKEEMSGISSILNQFYALLRGTLESHEDFECIGQEWQDYLTDYPEILEESK